MYRTSRSRDHGIEAKVSGRERSQLECRKCVSDSRPTELSEPGPYVGELKAQSKLNPLCTVPKTPAFVVRSISKRILKIKVSATSRLGGADPRVEQPELLRREDLRQDLRAHHQHADHRREDERRRGV